jgi:hypothetical protein
MIGVLCFVLAVLASPFKSKLRLQAENAVLRHQLIIVRRRLPGRVRLTNHDRWFLIQLYRWVPSILQVLTIVRPETLLRWHRAGFRCYWRWKSRPLGGRPRIDTELCALVRRMSIENPLWGAPRIHGELLKLGFEVAQSSVAKHMVKRRAPPSQGWRTFLRNHAPDIAAMDLFVVPTIGFDLLYAFVIVRLDRRDLVWISVTAHPTAEWVARQITEAFPWNEAPRYMIRDRDCIYGAVVTRRMRAMGIRDKPIAPASPWQNGFAERLIGSIRRECVDHIIVLGEAHLRPILKSYADYHNCDRTHRSLGCAGFSPGSANRCDQFTRHPGRTSSPLRPGLSCRYTQRAEHAVGSRKLVAERLRSRVGGRSALRRDGALLRHRLRRRATRRISRGRWRGRLSRWRRWRRRSLSGCRAGRHQSCQDQKRFSLHGEQMLPRCRCSLLVEKPTGVFGLPSQTNRS